MTMPIIPKKTALAVVLLALFPLVPSGAFAGDPFPFRPGDRWEYVDQSGTRETVSATRIVSLSGIPMLEMVREGAAPDYYLRTTEGVYRFTGPFPGKQPFPEPPVLVLKFPLEDGLSWTSSLSDPPISFTVQSRSPYSVPAGTFKGTLKIAYRPAPDPIYQGYIWFSPEVGIIAQEDNRYRSELTAHRPSDLVAPDPISLSPEELSRLFRAPGEPSAAAETPQGRSEEGGQTRSVFPRLATPAALLAIFLLLMAWLLRSHRKIDLEDDEGIQKGEIALASAMVREGLYRDAARILQRLTVKHPQWPDLAALLGRAYRELGRYEDACLELKRALTLNPEMVNAHLDLTRVYLAEDEPSRALEQVEAVLAANPSFADALCLRGEVFESMGKLAQAEADYRKALEINPSFGLAGSRLSALLARD